MNPRSARNTGATRRSTRGLNNPRAKHARPTGIPEQPIRNTTPQQRRLERARREQALAQQRRMSQQIRDDRRRQSMQVNSSPIERRKETRQRQAQFASAYSDRANPAVSRAVYMPIKKKRKWPKRVALVLLILLLLVGCGLFLFSCALDNSLSQNTDNEFEAHAVDYSKPFYILLLGSDSREGSNTSSRADESGDNQRSDVMVLLRCDFPNKNFTMISVPRDSIWTDPNGNVLKINEAYNEGGASLSCSAVEQLTGATVSHYVEIKISQLEGLVDALGGVEVTVPQDVSVNDTLTGKTIELLAGKQTLDGEKAQAFARARHEYGTNQDATRQSNVRTLIEAIAKKIVSGNPVEIPNRMIEAAKYVGTNIRSGDLYDMASRYLLNPGEMKMQSCSGPTNGAINSSTGLWMCYKNPQGWSNLFSTLDSGGDPNSINYSTTEERHS